MANEAKWRRCRSLGVCNGVRVGLALTLLLAAALKTHQLATQLVVGHGFLGNRWLLAFVVQFEFAFGLWLLFGFLPKLTRLASILLFSAFAAVALYKGLSGEPSCGCLGKVPTSPWMTLAFDCLAILLLLRFPPRDANACAPPDAHCPSSARAALYLGYVALAVTLMAVSGGAILRFEASRVGEGGQLNFGTSQVVILEPEQWIGKRLPILGYLSIGRHVERGSWQLVFFHHNCPSCRRVLAQHVHLAGSEAAARTAFVELPPFGSSVVLSSAQLIVGRLSSEYEWFVRTPCSVWLKDAIVTQVAKEL